MVINTLQEEITSEPSLLALSKDIFTFLYYGDGANMSSLILRSQRFQKPDVLSCGFDHAVLCFLPLKCTSLITNKLRFLATSIFMRCSFVIKVKKIDNSDLW